MNSMYSLNASTQYVQCSMYTVQHSVFCTSAYSFKKLQTVKFSIAKLIPHASTHSLEGTHTVYTPEFQTLTPRLF